MSDTTINLQIGKSTRIKLRKYLRRMHDDLDKAGAASDDYPSLSKTIPADVMEAINGQHSGTRRLCLDGGEAVEFYKLKEQLERDLSTEYLETKELENALWALVCKTSLIQFKGDANKAVLRKIEEFESKYCREIETYEILLPLDDFDLSHGSVALGEASVESYNYEKLLLWGPDLEKAVWKRILKTDSSKPMVKLVESGTSVKLMVQRASNRTNLLLDAIRSYAPYELRYLHDQQLLQKLSDSAFIKNLKTGKAYHTWKLQWCSWEFGWTSKGKCLLTQMQKDLINVKKMNCSIRSTIELSMHWLGAAVREPQGKMKIVLSCTAMETLLGDNSEGIKAQGLIKRMVHLNQILGTHFINPTVIKDAYEMRSDIIHGSIVSGNLDKTYTSMRFITIDTLIKVVQLVQQERIESKKGLMKLLNKDISVQ